ncbi:sulfotransferase [Glycomyces sp. A-F 0318]|uniref:sulfotransferase family protein n=1 Tax=Glycomyces amatae TaxID=2881355 RepID=UPI001E4BD10B|nr:sulfotransferase [Glycomyces amatae]MCD0445292.1 sulfotransferase [Glycomyces amatae]
MQRLSSAARAMNVLLAPRGAGRNPDRAWDRLVNQALERTGGDTAGSEAFIADYRVLFDDFIDAGLSPLGWLSVVGEARGRMENRFRIKRLIAERPEITRERIEAPIFVTGLPRTATTLTHNIIAGSQGHRGPLLWELHYTDVEVDAQTRAERVKAVGRQTSGLLKFSPIYELIHPLYPEKPEECVYILPHGVHQQTRATMPRYRAWLEARDFRADYQYLKEALQVLQYARAKARWVLKTPEHLNHLDLLVETFPGAKIVWTHRDPVTVLGSVCSLVETTSMLHMRRVDPLQVGRLWLDVLSSATEKGRAVQPLLPAGSVVHLPYHAVASDPWAHLPDLYRRLGAEWTATDEGRLEKVMERPIRDRRHEYTLGRYGLDPDQVERAFGDYLNLVTSVNR